MSEPKTTTFDRAYERLNPEQRAAVDAIEGPLMVLAGPGTGKTQVVSMRVANILRLTQARPSNILCLTFSNSGASAMRERLRGIIGPDAYGVTVTTIHGFCNDIILRHPEVFRDFSLMEQLTDVERCRILNTIIDQYKAHSVLINPKDPYQRTMDILQRISQCKREAVDPECAREAARLFAAQMEGKSKEGTKAQARNIRLAAQAAEFADLYDRYQVVLRERGLYDYDDMITFAMRGLQEEDWMLAALQERYQYILVDEYQDTNPSQNRVIATLTTYAEGIEQSPNLCVVGDDDQAIYRFQGASVRGMLAFRERFPDCNIVVLTANYRSTQPILDAAGRLIERNEDRLVRHLPDLTKHLRSAHDDRDAAEPQLLRPVSDAVEPFVLAERVQALLKQGIEPSEIAILTRTNGELFTVAEVFRGLGIPLQISGKLDLLRHAKVLELLSLLRAIAHPENNVDLLAGLGAPCFGCHSADIARLWIAARARGETRGEAWHIFSVLPEIEAMTDLHDASSLIAARDLLLSLHAQRSSKTLPELAEEVLHESGLLPRKTETFDPLDIVALGECFEHIKRRCYETPSFDLRALLADVEYRTQYAISLQYDVPHLTDNAVQIMTAHGSKGLEFEAVLIANFREKHWDGRRRQVGLSLPEELLFGGSLEEGIEDERRLAYVAWTRAKRFLLLSCPERALRGEREQDASPSAFAVEGGPLPEARAELADPTRASLLLLPRTAPIDGALESYLRSKLETFELSVTALNRFLEDPQSFLREDLLALPQAKTASLSYGTAVHEALRRWALAARDAKPWGEDEFIEAFRSAISEREILTEADRKRLLAMGEVDLRRFAKERLREVPFIHAVEQRLTARLIDPSSPEAPAIPIKGTIDRIDLEKPGGSAIHVIDFKTGKPKTAKEVLEGNNGNLHRQLVFYKLLIERSTQMVGYNATFFTLDFIGERDEEPKTLSCTIGASESAALELLIRKVWAKIIALDFTPVEPDAA